jgi:hypothetical protein
MFCPSPEDLGLNISDGDIAAVCEQLREHGLFHWKSIRSLSDGNFGMGRISAFGIDVVEGTAKPDIKVELVQSKTVNISGSTNVIVGDNNKLTVQHHIHELANAIDSSNSTPAEKAEAKGLLRQLVEHPLVAAIAGGAVGLLGG